MMRSYLHLLIAMLAISVPCAAANSAATWDVSGMHATYHTVVTFKAKDADAPAKVIFTGDVHFWSANKVAKTAIDIRSSKMTVQTASGAKTHATGLDLVKSADFVGPVKIVYSSVATDGTPTKTTAEADNATYDGATKLVHLVGNVKITQEDRSQYEEPVVATGDKATVNLKQELGADEFRFRMESSPGLSKIEVTPAQKEPKNK